MNLFKVYIFPLFILTISISTVFCQSTWQSKFVFESAGKLVYKADENGNIIPDFSRVGYHQGNAEFSVENVVRVISPVPQGESQTLIQKAIDEVSALPLNDKGLRGTILLKRGVYYIPGTLKISKSGVILKGEGNDYNGTVLVASGRGKRNLLLISGSGKRKDLLETKIAISDSYVPVGAFSFNVEDSKQFKVGDQIIVYRPGTADWIKDIKMDQIEERPGTKQWLQGAYDLYYERVITKIDENRIFIDNPIVMAMEAKYGGGAIFKYTFEERISEIGVDNIMFKSDYQSDTDEDHGWVAVDFETAENCWARNINSWYFGMGCINIGTNAKSITVSESGCFDPKSIITGGRRYSFCIDGQLNLVKNCKSDNARHDYVTGAKACGPNVFYNCIARNTYADIGPHHRWATGTLYDNIYTDGQINVQDRGNMGSGHGWAGANQVLWNCKAKEICVQSPWSSAKNYCIGETGNKYSGHFKDRPDGEWEGLNKPGLIPISLYLAQLKNKK
ncbi:MAG: hypothetical protein PHH37_03465 [Paludibacter sp.]|nr:hypothetical protein [Paludibacter sp.]